MYSASVQSVLGRFLPCRVVVYCLFLSLLVFFPLMLGCASRENSPKPAPVSDELSSTKVIEAQMKEISALFEFKSRADEECCTDPGSVAACWWQDAERDQVTCIADTECPGGNTCNKAVRYGSDDKPPPNGWGLCGCEDDSDCQTDEMQGVCTEIGGQKVCGPSFCNGYLVCACWGGCTAGKSGNYATPGAMCAAEDDGYPGECCEGNYPSDPIGGGIGFCSDSCDGTYAGSDCNVDSDCNDPVPAVYSADCVQQVCDGGTCRFDFVNRGDTCSTNVRSTDGYWGEDDGVRDELSGIFSCFVGRCTNAGKCESSAAEVDALPCDDDDNNTCTDEVCRSGLCVHDPTDHVGDLCNLDDNACDEDRCNAGGVCTAVGPVDCNDNNYCTYPDSCADTDPDHLIPSCVYTDKDGNAEDYGYLDLDDCEDLMCVGGAEVMTPMDCSAYNPNGYDLQCNDYVCVDGNGEDNCTLSYNALVGDACSDGDPCKVGDRCVDTGDHGVCEPIGDMDCDDHNECTLDSCNAGACVHDADVGARCDDLDLCTLVDTCDVTGSCAPGAPPDCTGLDNTCTNGVCDALTGNCIPAYLGVGSVCNEDKNACTDGVCDGAGVCNEGPPLDCSPMSDQCNTGVCNTLSGLCEKDWTPHEGDGCNADDSACTPNDTCASGVCTKDPAEVTCTAYSDQCNASFCNPADGMCEYHNATLVGTDCNLDNDGCTVEKCVGSAVGDTILTCTSDSTFGCVDGNQCTEDRCVSTGNMTHTCANNDLALGTACNADGNGCTANDQCNGLGVCNPGTTIDASACETEILIGMPGFDTDCNSAVCVSTGDNAHVCNPEVKVTNPGDCNRDFDACTLDTCGPFDPVAGAACVAGAPRDCSSMDNACQNGVCDDSGDYYNSSCAASYPASGTSCDADSDGCTVGDTCNGAGVCAAGIAPVCTPSDGCHTSACTSTGSDSYTCAETQLPGCCETVDDCIGQGLPCEGGGFCNGLICNAGVCECNVLNEGDLCDELAEGAYPQNCFTGVCNASGDCVAETADLPDVQNNLCSDLFDPSDKTALLAGNTANLGDLGPAAADGAMLSTTGSTLCGFNNYRADANNNCMEKSTGLDLGVSGNDVVYSFRYWTPQASVHEMYSYVVKVEADFDVGVYLQDGIADADACPEGNNPTQDTSTNVTVQGAGYLSWEIWTGVTGTSVSGMPPATAANSTGIYSSFEAVSGWGDNYVQRVRGYLTAPTTGTYTFWIASNDNSELYLSPDEISSNKVRIASVSGWTNVREWTKFSTQKSVGINLVAGTKYYIEALQKEGTGSDNLAVAWAKPGESTAAPSEVVPGRQLSPWDGNDTPTGSGTITFELWTGVTGSTVAAIPLTATPSSTGTFTSFEAPTNTANSYGRRIRGYLTAPFTGDYRFFVASNDEGELWLSSDRDPANKVRIVRTTANAASRVWTTNADQKSAPVSLVRGGKYYIEGLHKENSGNDNFAVGWAKPGESTAGASEVVPGAQLSPWDNGPQSGFGYVSWEKWNGIPGTSISSIPVDLTPNETGIHTGLQAIPKNWADNFGHRIRGFVLAPLTGAYTFWIAADETAEFWMSTDENPANKVRLATVPGATGFEVWNTYAAQKSAPVNLVAYRYYYIEILHKEGTGSDHLSVGWSKPGESTTAPSETLNKFQLAPWGLHDYSDLSDAAGNVCFDMWFGYFPTIGQIPVNNPADLAGAYDHLEGPFNWNGSSQYAQRIRGFLVPPTTGNYTFWVSADDKAELWLSTDDEPSNKVRIAYQTTSWANQYEWNKYASQKSAAISLVASRRYYIEVLHNETAGLDHIEVGWARPGQATTAPSQVIPAAYLDPLDEGCGKVSREVGWICKYPYTNTPMPDVVEEECSELGNTLSGQDCCDPCSTSCYNQCSRGYRTSDTSLCDLCSGDCEETWEVSEEPFSCESVKPSDADFAGYTDMALAVIEPKPVDAGSWRNVVVYVDGSHGDTGNFFLSVEKRKQQGSLCERINDNPGIIDVTNAGSSGVTYVSTLENLANSRHITAGNTSCGGYDCTEEWVADGTCHSGAYTPNAFWPAAEAYKIYRKTGLQTYCITAAPAASNGLNPVLTVMEKAGVENPCSTNLTVNTCAHANYMANQSQVQLTAGPGAVYLIEVSRYAGLTRPCDNAAGHNCDYTLTVKAGTCP